jgi:FixJ family two-component response regulator
MVGTESSQLPNTSDSARPTETRRTRTIVVAGRASRRTREVLHALRDFADVIWPTSVHALQAQAAATDAGCLVIADELGDENASDFLQEIRERNRELPIFVITDPGDLAEAVSAMRAGATAVIEIPPSYALLREEIQRATT